MKKKPLALLLTAAVLGTFFSPYADIAAQAAYQKRTLSDRIVMDSGNFNIVEWQEIGKDGDEGTWSAGKSNPYVTNLTDTGEIMILEPYASADLSRGDVTLSFDVLGCSDSAVSASEYGTHLYAAVEPAEGSESTSVTEKIANGGATAYYAYLHDGALVTDYAYEGGVQRFFADKGCTVPVAQVADFCTFPLANGRFTFTFTKERVLGVSIATETQETAVYIKDAFPAEYVSGEMRFGLVDWGYLKVDNLSLGQNGTVVSTDFGAGWNSAAEDRNCFFAENVVSRFVNGEEGGEFVEPHVTNLTGSGDLMVIKPYKTADLSKGNVTLSFDVKSASAASLETDYYTNLYALIEPKSGAASGIADGGATNYYAYMKQNLLIADYSYYVSQPSSIFYKDEACTDPYSYSGDFISFGIGEGRITFTYTANRVLGVTYAYSAGAVTVYIKDAFPAAYTSGEMRFGLADWGLLAIDNLELRQGDDLLCSCGFDGEWKSGSEDESKCFAEKYTQKGSAGKPTEANDYVSNKTGTGDLSVIETYATADLSRGDVTLSFDILKTAGAADGTDYPTNLYAVIEPKEGAAYKYADGGPTAYYAYLHGGALVTDYAYEAGVQKFYSDRACTVPVSQTADYCLFALAEGRFTFTFGQDRVLGVTMATASGTTTVYIKNAFPAAYTSGEMRFGLADWGLLEIDNLVVSQPGKIYECDFDGDWKASSAEEGKCYGSGYKLIKADGLVSENTGSAHRMVLKNAVSTDGLSVKYFSVEGKLSFDVLENSFGFCFGLPEKDSALEEGSYLRFYVAEDGTSRLACGEQDYLLPFDLVGYGYVEIAAEGLKGGILETVVCGQKYTFENVKFDGYIALAGNGEGAARVTVDKDLRIVKYAYQGSEGGEIATNFNTGFVDPDNWVMQNDKALYLADMTRANGVTFEDGRMNFDGAGMWAYFSTKQKYADYIVEFDYIQKHDLAVELKNGGYNGTFALCVASNAYAGNLNSYMISILYYPDINIVRMNDYSSGVYAGNYDFASSQVFYEEERDVVTAVKVVVANNKAIMYTQNITDAEFDKDAYVKAGEWTLEDTFGYVGIAADEGCFQSFDNFRITPIDHPDAAEVEKNIASFVDRKPIADEKFVLAAPVIVADEGGEISWDAVKGADGYIVTVNGVSSGMQTATVYKPEGNGEYVVTVRAVGSGAWVTGNSEESNKIRVVIGNPEESGQPDSGSSASTGKSGCLSGLGTETAGLLLLLGAAVAVVRRKRIS